MKLVHLRGSIALLPEVQGQKAPWLSRFVQQGLPVFALVILEGENLCTSLKCEAPVGDFLCGDSVW